MSLESSRTCADLSVGPFSVFHFHLCWSTLQTWWNLWSYQSNHTERRFWVWFLSLPEVRGFFQQSKNRPVRLIGDPKLPLGVSVWVDWWTQCFVQCKKRKLTVAIHEELLINLAKILVVHQNPNRARKEKITGTIAPSIPAQPVVFLDILDCYWWYDMVNTQVRSH